MGKVHVRPCQVLSRYQLVSPYLTRCPRNDKHVTQHKAQVKGMPVLQLLRTCTACRQVCKAWH